MKKLTVGIVALIVIVAIGVFINKKEYNNVGGQSAATIKFTEPVVSPVVSPKSGVKGGVATDPVNDITSVAAGLDNISTFVSLVQKAGLSEVLRAQTGPFTVFAPTNEAFAQISLDYYLRPDNKPELIKLLTYHIASGRYPVVNLSGGTNPLVKSVQGNNLGFTLFKERLVINSKASIIASNTTPSNGIIHSINVVLSPSDNPQPDPRSVDTRYRRGCTDNGDGSIDIYWQVRHRFLGIFGYWRDEGHTTLQAGEHHGCAGWLEGYM